MRDDEIMKTRNKKINGQFYTDDYIHNLNNRIYELEKTNDELGKKLKDIIKLIRRIIDEDEEVDIYTLFDIQDIIDDKEDQKLAYSRYVKSYIE